MISSKTTKAANAAKPGKDEAAKPLEGAKAERVARLARRNELQSSLKTAREGETKNIETELESLGEELKENQEEIKAAEAEEKGTVEEKGTEKEKGTVEEKGTEKEKGTVEEKGTGEMPGEEDIDRLKQLVKGSYVRNTNGTRGITVNSFLKESEFVFSYKNGFGNPAIVVDMEIPKWPILRIRKDVSIPSDCANLMNWRRAGKVKGSSYGKIKEKWSSSDIDNILGIAIEVPEGYEGDPEDLVKLIEKKNKKKSRHQPDVQLWIQWKEGMDVDDGDGIYKRHNSLECRSGCHMIFKNNDSADRELYTQAVKFEQGYRDSGGKHPSEVRGPSPYVMRSSQEPSETEESTDNEDEKASKKQDKKKKKEKKKEKKKKVKKEEEETEGEEEEEDKPMGLKKFREQYLELEEIEEGTELTPKQKGELIEAYAAYTKKVRGNK